MLSLAKSDSDDVIEDALVEDHAFDGFVDTLYVQLVDVHCDYDLADLLVDDLLLLDDPVVSDELVYEDVHLADIDLLGDADFCVVDVHLVNLFSLLMTSLLQITTSISRMLMWWILSMHLLMF